MTNVKLIVQYDGTRYHGFQRQNNLVTIQSELERAFFSATGEEVVVRGAGRTDAGVHAEGQVASAKLFRLKLPFDRLPVALNAHLAPDIVVTHAAPVPDDFDPRFSALAKTYRYRLFEGSYVSPFWRPYVYQVPADLDLAAMQAAAARLVGRHDFSSFRSAGSSATDPWRTVSRAALDETYVPLAPGREARMLTFTIQADGFLYKMVRNIVGTLLLVGRGKLTPDGFAGVLDARDRTLAGPAAPAKGLCLVGVDYPPGLSA